MSEENTTPAETPVETAPAAPAAVAEASAATVEAPAAAAAEAPAATAEAPAKKAPKAKAAPKAKKAGAAGTATTAAPSPVSISLDDTIEPIKIVKAKGSKNIIQGIAHVQASFNNTIISITDQRGAIIGWSIAASVASRAPAKAPPTPLRWLRRTPAAKPWDMVSRKSKSASKALVQAANPQSAPCRQLVLMSLSSATSLRFPTTVAARQNNAASDPVGVLPFKSLVLRYNPRLRRDSKPRTPLPHHQLKTYKLKT